MPLEPFGAMLETRNGEFWVGSQYGLQRFRKSGWTTLDVRNAGGAGALDVHCLAEGRNGELWAGTSDGLIRLQPVSVKTFTSNPGSLREKDFFQAVLAEPHQFWAAVAGEGLLKGEPGNLEPVSTDVPSTITVSALCKARDSSLWIGTQGNYLWWYGGGKVRSLSKSPAGVAARGINAVLEDWAGRVWLGTWEGLMAVDGAQISPMPVVGGSGNSRSHLLDAVHCLLEDREKTLWVGYQTQGLLMMTAGGKQRRFGRADGLPSNSIHALCQDSDGVLWIGTPAGLGRWTGSSLRVFAGAQGLEDEDVRQIVADKIGNLWLGARTGIYRISRAAAAQLVAGRCRDRVARRFGPESGMTDDECTGGFGSLCTRTGDGKLWFCTHGGLVMADPAKLAEEKTNSLPVFLEEFMAEGKPVWAQGIFSQGAPGPRSYFATAPGETFFLQPGSRDIEFHFSAPSFGAPERIRFRWWLEGFENGWSAPATVRAAAYPSLPPKQYRFRVSAVDASGIWREAAPLTFEVLPHFWQARWFRALTAVALLGCIGLGAHFFERRRTRRKMERLQREQAVERERMRIARDIHDDLGARLTQIMLLSQPAGEAESTAAKRASDEIYDTARSLVQDVTEIVWAVNPEHDTLDSLAAYFGEFAQRFLGPSGVRCRLDFPLNLEATPLGSHVRHNLFLAYKEALNNVVKHAKASKAEISLTLQRGGFLLAIRDDGCGVPAQPSKERVIGGNGLNNMRHRLTEIGGCCEICAGAEGGTVVNFIVPLKGK